MQLFTKKYISHLMPCLDRIVLQHRVDISSANVKQEISTLLRLLKVNKNLSDQNAPKPHVDISSANVKEEISTPPTPSQGTCNSYKHV
jgi:hypothetical protein